MARRRLPTQLWEDHRNLVYKWANDFARRCPSASLKELEAQGRLAFAEALSTWDPAKGMFSTHLVWQLRHRLGLHIAQETRWATRNETGAYLEDEVPLCRPAFMRRLLECLTPRGKRAVLQALRTESIQGIDLRAREEVRRALKELAFT